MLLDASTLRDLEVLSPLTPNGPTLWNLVDRTRTRAGRKALRDRLAAPFSSAEQILDLRIRLLHFAADTANGQPVFDYLLREGVSTQRLGMTLLRQEQVLDLLGAADAAAS